MRASKRMKIITLGQSVQYLRAEGGIWSCWRFSVTIKAAVKTLSASAMLVLINNNPFVHSLARRPFNTELSLRALLISSHNMEVRGAWQMMSKWNNNNAWNHTWAAAPRSQAAGKSS